MDARSAEMNPFWFALNIHFLVTKNPLRRQSIGDNDILLWYSVFLLREYLDETNKLAYMAVEGVREPIQEQHRSNSVEMERVPTCLVSAVNLGGDISRNSTKRSRQVRRSLFHLFSVRIPDIVVTKNGPSPGRDIVAWITFERVRAAS